MSFQRPLVQPDHPSPLRPAPRPLRRPSERVPPPPFWDTIRNPVTVCIAAYSRAANAIVTVSDALLSSEWEAYDGVLKIDPLHLKASWYALYAGWPEEYEAVRHHIKVILASLETPQLDDVLAAATAAYAKEICTAGDVQHLTPLGVTRAKFLEDGLRYFGDVEFARILKRLSKVRLGASLLVIGFDNDGGHIAEVTASGRAFRRSNNPPFYAIGSGAFAARALLNTDPEFWARQSQVEPMVYKLCAAKFAAQATVRTVGEKTMAMLFSQPVDGRRRALTYLQDFQLRGLRDIWFEQTVACPPAAIEHIKAKILDSARAVQLLQQNALPAPESPKP